MATPMGARSAPARRERSRLSGGNGALEPIGRRLVVQDLSSLLSVATVLQSLLQTVSVVSRVAEQVA